MHVATGMLPADAHRALELLEDYHSQLTNATERPLRSAIERVIRIFKSRLFQALLGNSNPSFYGCGKMNPVDCDVMLMCLQYLSVCK